MSRIPSKSKLSFFIKLFKLVLLILLGLFICGILIVTGLNDHLQSNKEKIFSDIPFLHGGVIKFEETELQLFTDFPNASLVLNKVTLNHPEHTLTDHPNILDVDELRVQFKVIDWRNKEFEITTLTFNGGQFTSFKNEDGLNGILSMLENHKSIDSLHTNKSNININADQLNLELENFDIQIVDSIKTSSIHIKANNLFADLNYEDEIISGSVDMDLVVQELTFKKVNGSFVKDSRVSGKFDVFFDQNILEISPFDLHVNEHIFNSEAKLDLSNTIPSTLSFENVNSNLETIKPLLSENIQEDVLPYHIYSPFYSLTNLILIPKKPALVDIDFALENNNIKINNTTYKKVSLDGRLINRKYDDGRRMEEGSGNTRIILDNITAHYNKFLIKAPDAEIWSYKNEKTILKIAPRITGKAIDINNILKNSKYIFEEGLFILDCELDGSIENLATVIIESEADLSITDLSVYYKPAEVAFPFESLKLKKQSGTANFSIVSSTVSQNNDFRFDGNIQNVSSLLLDDPQINAHSEIAFYAPKLAWKDFLELFGENGYMTKTDRQKKRSMKETMSGLQDKFEPNLSIRIDSVLYGDIQFENLTTGIHFIDESTIQLKKTNFDLYGGQVELTSKLNISDPLLTSFEIELSTKQIDVEYLLPKFNYFNIELLRNIETLPDDLNLDIKLSGIIDDVKGLLPNSAKGKIKFNSKKNKKLRGVVQFAPGFVDQVFEGKIPPMKTSITLVGDPVVFNDFFNNDEFFFSEGDFRVQFDYEGDVTSIEELLNMADVTFSMDSSLIYYKPVDITFPITQLGLDITKDVAEADVFMRAASYNQEIKIDAKVENISEMILGNTGKSTKTTLDISSPRLVWKDIFEAFAKGADKVEIARVSDSDQDNNGEKVTVVGQASENEKVADSDQVSENERVTVGDHTIVSEQDFEFTDIGFKDGNRDDIQIDDVMKRMIKTILNNFDPTVHVKVDTFEFSKKLHVYDLKTGIELIDSSIVYLDETGFRFLDGDMSLMGQIDLSTNDESPIIANLETEDLDVVGLMQTLDYFGIESLQQADKLEGRISMTLNMNTALSADGKGFVIDKTNALLKFALDEVEIEGLDIIDSIATKIRMKRKMKELKFASLNNTLTIIGREILIPQMEVQSNALNLFVEGSVNQNGTDVWLSIPLDNMNPRELQKIPHKRGYAMAGKKIFLRLTNNNNEKSKMKLHLNNKKLYEAQARKDEYRKDRRHNRRIRRIMRRLEE